MATGLSPKGSLMGAAGGWAGEGEWPSLWERKQGTNSKMVETPIDKCDLAASSSLLGTELCPSPPPSRAEALIPNVTVCGDRVLKEAGRLNEAIRVGLGSDGISALKRTDTRSWCLSAV